MKRNILYISIISIFFFFVANFNYVMAQMSSTNYKIDWDSFSTGGDDVSSSASYKLRDSVSNVSDGSSSSTNYSIQNGYRQGVFDRVATFNLLIENKNTQVAAVSRVSNTINVSTVSGYSVGNFVILVQNEGIAQNSAIGKITLISGTDITLDFFTASGTIPTIDGASDYLYNLNGTSFNLGTLTSSAVNTGIIGWEVNADINDGYSVYVYEDQNLKISGGATLADVSDGAVTAGASEYGAISSDSTLIGSTFDTLDTAFNNSMQIVGSRNNNSFLSRDFLTLKASTTGTQISGSYSHALTFVYVGDY